MLSISLAVLGAAFFCLILWARFVEPNLLFVSRYKIPGEHPLTLLFLSDLHFDKRRSEKILKKVKRLKPDTILLGGDFLNSSTCEDFSALQAFLQALKAPLGVAACLGNHDYSEPVGVVAKEGTYGVIRRSSLLLEGLKALFSSPNIARAWNDSLPVTPHPQLLSILQKTGIQLLRNSSCRLGPLHVSGLGEYTSGDCFPLEEECDILLCHNPDGFRLAQKMPCKLILGGHTHGGQISLPLLWKQFTLIENKQWRKGWSKVGKTPCFVSRGVGSTVPFRLFSPPEITLLEIG